MKRLLRSLFGFLLALVLGMAFCCCDSGLRYIKMRVVTIPEKTVYYSDKDQVLDFNGGVIEFETVDGRKETVPMMSYTYQQVPENKSSGSRRITSDVNFSVPGEYTVTIWQTESLSCQYSILVVQSEQEQSDGLRIDSNNSYFLDFYIEHGNVVIKCHYSIENETSLSYSIQLRGYFEEDQALGLVQESQLLAQKDEGKDTTTFLVLPGKNEFDIIYVGTYGGTNKKADRLLPKTDIYIISCQ